MASHHEHDDPPEFTGRNQTQRADPPKGKRAAPNHPGLTDQTSKQLAEEMASPVPPSVAVYNPPAEGEAHPKIARLAPAQRLDEAEANLGATQLDLAEATAHLRNCEMIEADALAALISVMPGPTADEVFRDKLAKEQAAKLARVDQGLSPTEPKQITARSPVDIAAAQRPRQSAQQPSTALRSPVARRLV